MALRGAVVGAVMLLASLPMPTDAGNAPLVFTRDSLQRDQPVEQQSPDWFYGGRTHPETWVVNPTDCDWDVDDHESWAGTGVVAAGASASARLCQVSDGLVSFGHYEAIQAFVSARTPDLTVTVTTDFGDSWTLTPVAADRGYTYRLCVAFVRPGPYPTIADSNGGYGWVVSYTLSITAAAHAARNVSAVLQHGPGIYSVC